MNVDNRVLFVVAGAPSGGHLPGSAGGPQKTSSPVTMKLVSLSSSVCWKVPVKQAASWGSPPIAASSKVRSIGVVIGIASASNESPQVSDISMTRLPSGATSMTSRSLASHHS